MVRAIRIVERVFMAISCLALAVLMFLGTVDVIGRYFFNRPIYGAYDLNVVCLAALVAFGVAYVQFIEKHVAIDLLYVYFPPIMRKLSRIFTHTIMFVVGVLVTWQSFEMATDDIVTKEAGGSFEWHVGYIELLVPIGFALFCIEVLLQLFVTIKEKPAKEIERTLDGI